MMQAYFYDYSTKKVTLQVEVDHYSKNVSINQYHLLLR